MYGDELIIDRTWTIELTRKLVSINSVNPSLVAGAPGEIEIAAYLADVFTELGLEVHTQEAAEGRPNAIGILRGQGGGRSLMINGHTDTVDVDGMTIPPFEPRLAPPSVPPNSGGEVGDGRIYGRGSFDMKGGLAAAIAAMKAIIEAGGTLQGDVILVAVADEEYASIGIQKVLTEYSADAAIICEPTDLDIVVAHKGFSWIEIETMGRAAHGSRFEEGVDAIAHMGRVLAELERLQTEVYPRSVHPLLGQASIHASLIEGGLGLSTYPDRCKLQVERRNLPGEIEEDVAAEMQALGQRLAKGDPQFEFRSRVFFTREAVETPTDAPIVQVLAAASQQVLGRDPQYIGQPWWTEMSLMTQAGIPSVLYGPSGAGAHAAVEWVDAESIVTCAMVMAQALCDFCGVAGG